MFRKILSMQREFLVFPTSTSVRTLNSDSGEVTSHWLKYPATSRYGSLYCCFMSMMISSMKFSVPVPVFLLRLGERIAGKHNEFMPVTRDRAGPNQDLIPL